MIRSRSLIFTMVCVLIAQVGMRAQTAPQTAPPQSFTLEQAMRYAVDHYPTVRAALEQVNGRRPV